VALFAVESWVGVDIGVEVSREDVLNLTGLRDVFWLAVW
jgi:hypothetical protein